MRFRCTQEGCSLLRLTDGVRDVSTPWLVTSTLGDGEALDAALRYEGLTPVGGVAAPLTQQGEFLSVLI